MILIYITCKNRKQAEEIGSYLLKKRLAACINIFPEISSIYRWEGKVEKIKEAVLIVKTIEKNFEKIEAEIKKLHIYTVPSIFSIKVDKVHKEYLGWLEEEIR